MDTVVFIGITIGLVEMLKRIGFPEKFLPLVSILFGIGFAVGSVFFTGGLGIFEAITQGLIIGLSAVGLYSSTKNVVEGMRE